MDKNPQQIDKSITLPGTPVKYGARLFRPKEIIRKPDTSTSIVVDWKNSKKMSPQKPEKDGARIRDHGHKQEGQDLRTAS